LIDGQILNFAKLQPGLSGNPFLLLLYSIKREIAGKKDWERKAEIAAQIKKYGINFS